MEQDYIPTAISKGRFTAGVVIFVVGQASTLLIPFVTASNLSSAWKATLSGLFFFVTPQIGIVLAVAILGKAGWERLVKFLLSWFKKYAPPEAVSPVRYRIGLFMFAVPLLWGLLEPYCGHLIPGLSANRRVIAMTGDIMLMASFFVLGGEFWDKIRALFIRGAKVQFSEGK